jgi:hypothetical protein
MALKLYGGAGPDHVRMRSGYSTDEGPNCVGVATARAHILVRDSKNPDGPRLTLAPTT